MKAYFDYAISECCDPSTLAGAAFYAIVIGLGAWAFRRILKSLVTKAIERDHRGLVDRTAAPFLVQLMSVVIFVIALVLYAHLVPELHSVGTALLAGAGVASVIIGLAAQNTFGNLIAGVSLLLYRPFQVGDRVQVTAPTGLETGVVEVITLGYTILLTGDNRRIVVPNSAMGNQVTINLTSVDPRIVVTVPFTIGYASDIDKARAILLELARAHADVQEVAGCPLTMLGDSSMTLTLRVWCKDAALSKQIEHDLLEQVKKRFDAEGIEIPFPYRNVVLKTPLPESKTP